MDRKEKAVVAQPFRSAITLLAFGTILSAQSAVKPQEHLNRAADAVLKLKSAQFTLTREGTPAFLDEKTGVTFTAAQCVYAAPDRVSCDVKISSKSGTVLQLTRVWVPEGTFQSNPLTRQFGKAPADSTFNGAVLFARAGIPDILRTSVQTPQLVGNETVRNRRAVHLRGEVRGDKLSVLIGSGSTIKPELMYPVDMWVEDPTAYPLKIHVIEPAGNGWLIDLFALNEPVDIPTPKVPEPPKP
jgi:LppX_LprAFG lipoprotein